MKRTVAVIADAKKDLPVLKTHLSLAKAALKVAKTEG